MSDSSGPSQGKSPLKIVSTTDHVPTLPDLSKEEKGNDKKEACENEERKIFESFKNKRKANGFVEEEDTIKGNRLRTQYLIDWDIGGKEIMSSSDGDGSMGATPSLSPSESSKSGSFSKDSSNPNVFSYGPGESDFRSSKSLVSVDSGSKDLESSESHHDSVSKGLGLLVLVLGVMVIMLMGLMVHKVLVLLALALILQIKMLFFLGAAFCLWTLIISVKEMQPLEQQQSRINVTELKTQIVKKLGPDRSKRENLQLHNQLIRSILKNVCHAKVPPPIYEKEALQKPTVTVGKKSPLTEDGHQQSGSLPTPTPVQNSLIWSNGDVLPMSPRKSRSGLRDRRSRDRPSPLGPNGKTDFNTHSATTPEDGCGKIIAENGDLKSNDFQRSVQHHQGLPEQPDNEREALLQRPTKRPRTKKSPDDPVSVHNKEPLVRVFEDGDMAQQGCKLSSARSPVCAPLGIPFCSASVGGSRKALPTSNSHSFAISSDSGLLFDTETLRKRMEQIVGAQGLEGVSSDCANLLNNGLDVYLKRLIRSCIQIGGSKSGQEPTKLLGHKQQPQRKPVNGIRPEYQLQMQSSSGFIDSIQDTRTRCPISLLDFKVAMELNPQQLGEDWPLLLEKICLHECEE
ncbi:hypothetical protein IFM89_029009 [Coptis chinensis]|uniref:Uncharacterized protein n=1 Tax=Coptis chinensis TaxID=261450 RepID=A0A835IGP3_9MAGN|nr:hypothetical protein IFM89_029009 [Coptis chinensis]